MRFRRRRNKRRFNSRKRRRFSGRRSIRPLRIGMRM